jgi:hypothetical protein
MNFIAAIGIVAAVFNRQAFFLDVFGMAVGNCGS